MKKIEKRAFLCLILAAALILGLGFYVVRYVLYGNRWASFAANRHLYNSQGQLSVGRVLDRDGDVLSWADDEGNRHYYENATVRKATLHAVGDAQGKIGTGALPVLSKPEHTILLSLKEETVHSSSSLFSSGAALIPTHI